MLVQVLVNVIKALVWVVVPGYDVKILKAIISGLMVSTRSH